MKIDFNSDTKIWKSLNHTNEEYFNQFLGEAFLENVKRLPGNKILECHYDTGVNKSVEDLCKETKSVAMNLLKLGVKKGDVVVMYSMVNSKISSLTMGALMVGAVVNFFETTFQKGKRI